MKITQYSINTKKIKGNIKIACVSDLHGRPSDKVIAALKSVSPNIILLAGDIFEVTNKYMEKRNANSFGFLKKAVKIAPVYYCFGNHELYYSHARKEKNRICEPEMRENYTRIIKEIGVNIINDSYAFVNGLNENDVSIGGIVCGYDKLPNSDILEINRDALDEYAQKNGFKILICHYPHYYEKYLKNTDFDIIVAGHAHGGHWRIFNRGVYAPHQGLFPKYSAGMFDGRFIISTGAANNSKPIPRFFNPTEIIQININNSEEM